MGPFDLDIVLYGSWDAKEWRQMPLRIPLIIHGPVALLASFPFLVTLSSTIERVLEDLISNDAVLDSDGASSFSENGDEKLGSDSS